MRFWDSSALVPLVLAEPASGACAALLREGPQVVVWAFTRTEMISALQRKARMGELSRRGLAAARARLDLLEASWAEVEPTRRVRARAERLLALHPLRAADALQLGAALVVSDDQPRGHAFITRDARLGLAAEGEGFTVFEPGPE